MDIPNGSAEVRRIACWSSLFLATVITCCPFEAAACLYPPPSPREAEETDAHYVARTRAEIDDYLLERARKTQASYFDEAVGVYFATIIRSRKIDIDKSPVARAVVLKPELPIKGKLPRRSITIKDRELTSCGVTGDGPATSGKVGQTAIVFDGVRNEGVDYRSRRYAILMEDVQEPRLLTAWRRWKAHAADPPGR